MCFRGLDLHWGRLLCDMALSQCLLWAWSIAFFDILAVFNDDEKLSARWS
jgi:hypothetical protein